MRHWEILYAILRVIREHVTTASFWPCKSTKSPPENRPSALLKSSRTSSAWCPSRATSWRRASPRRSRATSTTAWGTWCRSCWRTMLTWTPFSSLSWTPTRTSPRPTSTRWRSTSRGTTMPGTSTSTSPRRSFARTKERLPSLCGWWTTSCHFCSALIFTRFSISPYQCQITPWVTNCYKELVSGTPVNIQNVKT